MTRTMAWALAMAVGAASLGGCYFGDGGDYDVTPVPASSSDSSGVVSADATKVVLTDRTAVDEDAGAPSPCDDTGQIYTLDLVHHVMSYAICRSSRPLEGAIQLTRSQMYVLQEKLDAISIVQWDTNQSGFSDENYLELAVTTDRTTERYVDLFYASENGFVNTVTGALDLLLQVRALVDAVDPITLADASVGPTTDGAVNVQSDAGADAPGDAGCDAELDTDADAH